MESFLIGVDNILLDTIKEGPYVPTIFITSTPTTEDAPATKDRYQVKEKDFWSYDDKKKVSMMERQKVSLSWHFLMTYIIQSSIAKQLKRFGIPW